MGIDKFQAPPYKSKGNGQTNRHNMKMADVILKFCAEKLKKWDTTLPYLNFVYNTTINRTRGARPFSMVHGQECQYPVEMFYAEPHNKPSTKDGFMERPDEQLRDAHSSAREVLGMDQRRQKDQYRKKLHGEPSEAGEKVWVWAKERAGQREKVF